MLLRMIRRHFPHIQWVVSFADGRQKEHGTIYQSSNWLLTAGITKKRNLARLPNGTTLYTLTVESNPDMPKAEDGGRTNYDVTFRSYGCYWYISEVGDDVLDEYQFR